MKTLARFTHRVLFLFALAACGWQFTKAADIESPRAIFVMNVDGSDVRNVVYVEDFKWLGSPRWSQDGQRIAFDARGAGPGRFMVVDVTGRNLIDLGAGAKPDWSPDDKQIVYEVPNVGRSSIWVQNSDGKASSWLGNGNAPRWSPDGSLLVVLEPLRFLDLAAGGERSFVDSRHDLGKVLSCAWSPDGTCLAAVVERKRGRELLLIQNDKPAESPQLQWRGELHPAVSWSPDGKQLALSVRNRKTNTQELHVLEVAGREPPRLIVGQEGDNREPAWSPDGKLLAFASSRRIAARTVEGNAPQNVGARLELVRRHDRGGSVYSVAYTSDGLAIVGGDLARRSQQVWDPTKGEVVQTIKTPGIFIAVSPDGTRFAATYPGDFVIQVQLENGQPKSAYKPGAEPTSVRFSPDGQRLLLALADHSAVVMNANNGNELLRLKHDAEVRQAVFSPNGRLIATASEDKKLHLWDAVSGQHLRALEHPATVWCAAFLPDSTHVITGTGGTMTGPWRDLQTTLAGDNCLRVWNVETGHLSRQLTGHTDLIMNVAVSPDGKRAASASFDHTLRLWELSSGRELDVVKGKGWVTDVAFSPDGGQMLASGGTEKDRNTGRWHEAPEERVRLFRIVAGSPNPAPDKPTPEGAQEK